MADSRSRSSQVILGKHKRSTTQRTPAIRHITLNGESLAVLKKYCEGNEEADHIFRNSDGMPFNRKTLAKRFNRVKKIVGEKNLGKVRDEITIYSFRDLWNSEALTAANDIATVARMTMATPAVAIRCNNLMSHDRAARTTRSERWLALSEISITILMVFHSMPRR